MLEENLKNRLKMITHLRDEVMGPCSNLKAHGQELHYDDSKRKWILPENTRRQSYIVANGEMHEVLGPDETPIQRYGVGVLYCCEENVEVTPDEEQSKDKINTEEVYGNTKTAAEFSKELDKKLTKIENSSTYDDDSTITATDDTLTGTNLQRPTTMGISFQLELERDGKILISLNCARYERLSYVTDREDAPAWWLRKPINLEYEINASDLNGAKISIKKKQLSKQDQEKLGAIDLELSVFPRQAKGPSSQRLLTICFVNRTVATSQLHRNMFSLFQTEFEIKTENGAIQPYAEARCSDTSKEEQTLNLLYSNQPIFATGHGCSADWGEPQPNNPFIRKIKNGAKTVTTINATPFPCYELANISAEIKSEGKTLTASMKALGGLDDSNDGLNDLRLIVDGYETWINEKNANIKNQHPLLQKAAKRHMAECQSALSRMRDGIALLKTDEQAQVAFKLANEAIYIQQKRAGSTRKWQGNPLSLEGTEEEFFKPEDRIGKWRPFQIAFILMNLSSTIDRTDPLNENVELIWFPTGGGKTEAYLGLAAFAIILRRLQNSEDTGTQVLMRYTLRLLTSQQFQRASGLVCALEHIRLRENKAGTFELGETPISIGLWVGGSNTPNTNKNAITALKNAKKPDELYQFVLQRCPWCGAQMGPVKAEKNTYVVKGIVQIGQSVEFRCPDHKCDLKNGIPVSVIDEQIYNKPPTIIIGTVDKFASLAWRPEIRKIFGLNQNGEREKSPPNLIIQDELHLITGPLGTVCSTYETIIEELCTDHRGDVSIKPKIVSATATTRNYKEQIHKLYARDTATIFPPPGLSADDSYFSTSERDKSGNLTPGRIHVGLMATGYASLQTASVRAFSSLLNTPSYLPDDEKDPWWTLLVFYNSIRELGGALTLFMGDIPERMAVLRKRLNNRKQITDKKIEYDNARWLSQYGIKELTSRIRNDEVPKAIEDLETPYNPSKTGSRAYDVCLASSIIEVGVDIQRLSMMAIVGQPKTTAQYIQVAGRVGRDRSKPGLVVTQYSSSKPRDRSHFERFKSYHERLYSMVEPASLTPFTPPAVRKALTGVIASYLRQMKDQNSAHDPRVAVEHLDECCELIQNRCKEVAPDEMVQLQQWLDQTSAELQDWNRDTWSMSSQMGDNPAQLRRAGSPCHPDWEPRTWPTMNSMRSVDTECSAQICQQPTPQS